MDYPVFLSHPAPYLRSQKEFIDRFRSELTKIGLVSHTIGVTDYDMDSPLRGIRSLMSVTDGLIAIALKRHHVITGKSKDSSDIGASSVSLDGQFFTSPFCQIEPAMAFQLGLPVLVFREKGVFEEGMLEPRATGLYTPEFSADSADDIDRFFESDEYKELMREFYYRVRSVHNKRGQVSI